ncbi:MAG: PucR family transcriptional regulator, partial [Actinomycetes bacterium]
LPWVKPDELLLTTGYPLREDVAALPDLVNSLEARGVAALAVKLGRYLEEIPAAMVLRADELGFPVIRLPEHVAFDDVLDAVLTDVLDHQAAVLARSEEVHRALVATVLAGGGVPEVTHRLAELLSATVMITTPDGRILAQAGDPDRLAELLAGPCFEVSGRFRTEREPRGVSEHDGLRGSHAVVPILAGSLDHGRLIAFGDGLLGSADVHLLEGASSVAALAVTRALAVAAVQEKYRGDFLRDVLSGRAGSPADVIAHAATLDWDLSRPVAVVVAELDREGSSGSSGPAGYGAAGPGGSWAEGVSVRPARERFAAAWQTVLASRDPHAPVASFGREVVALIGVTNPDTLERIVRELVQAVSGDGGGGRRPFSTGVSRVVSPASGGTDALPTAYEQARTAVRVGRQLRGSAALTHFDNLGVLRLLSLLPDGREVEAFVQETLRELAHPTDPEATDLRRTLQVLLDRNLNVAEAARELHFHYNTLRYRISKLERVLGPFTRDPAKRLDLMLALQIVAMRDEVAVRR